MVGSEQKVTVPGEVAGVGPRPTREVDLGGK